MAMLDRQKYSEIVILGCSVSCRYQVSVIYNIVMIVDIYSFNFSASLRGMNLCSGSMKKLGHVGRVLT